jgi:hypothetical protein
MAGTSDECFENGLVSKAGVPNLTHPSFQKFVEARNALMSQEKSQRSGKSSYHIRGYCTYQHNSQIMNFDLRSLLQPLKLAQSFPTSDLRNSNQLGRPR